MSKGWYYQVMGEIIGPVSSAELRAAARAGIVCPGTFIRKGTTSDWISAMSVENLIEPPKLQDGISSSHADEHASRCGPLSADDLDAIALEAVSVSSPKVKEEEGSVKSDVATAGQSSKWRKCPDCGNMVSKRALQCPTCGRSFTSFQSFPVASQAGSRSVWFIIIPLSVIVGLIYWGFQVIGVMEPERPMERIHQQAQEELRRIEREVAEDAVRQYDIAKRSGAAMDAYIHAGLVAAAYIQAKDEVNYRKWKAIEYQEGIRAGVPQN
ncbi:MAG: DUF4339 domain-containing protein [Planctomycetes bacterium]|nr:DUF4339 domain-containing protein [Planctomycetota bacterium]MBU4399562.1 DUF4339 domain-containing protein [Planctomycetota bacterium]MCG2684370.1 GYF domain-containing protein [Planctomycetales bacterium]